MIEKTLGGQGERTKDVLLEELGRLVSGRAWSGDLSQGERITADGRKKRNGSATVTIHIAGGAKDN